MKALIIAATERKITCFALVPQISCSFCARLADLFTCCSGVAVNALSLQKEGRTGAAGPGLTGVTMSHEADEEADLANSKTAGEVAEAIGVIQPAECAFEDDKFCNEKMLNYN